jgi:hypothetical protein
MLVLRTRPEMLARLTGARDIANHTLILDFQMTKQTKRLAQEADALVIILARDL